MQNRNKNILMIRIYRLFVERYTGSRDGSQGQGLDGERELIFPAYVCVLLLNHLYALTVQEK